jgi:hypothetical protein
MRAVIVIVILLFSVVTFNAYACLIPLSSSSLAMEKDCSSPQEEQTPQWCDFFKTLGVESTVSVSDSQHSKSVLAFDFQGLDQVATQTSQRNTCYRSDHQLQQPPSDLFLKLVTLRI